MGERQGFALLKAVDIHKKFTNSVLNGVTIEISPGEVIGIAGENGSGKSTLLSIMAGLKEPDEGHVVIEGKVGYIPQETALFENLTVKDNIKFWASAHKVPYMNKYAGDLDLNKKVKQLSGGMKKRLSIVLASMHMPDYLVMDEPTAALDIGFKGELAKMIKEAKKQNQGVVFTTHQPDELLWCDRIYILRGGVFVYEGSPRKIDNLSYILYGKDGSA